MKDGPSTLTLAAGTNSLAAALVDNGTLVATAANVPPVVTLANNTNLTFYQATAGTLSTVVSGTGTLGKTGPGVLTIGAPYHYVGPTTISGGTLQLGAAPAAIPGLLVHYTMDGSGPIGNGATIADSSGNGNNAIMAGSGAYVAGQFGQAIQITASYLLGPNNSTIDSLQAWTDSVWINVNSSYGSNHGSGMLVATRDNDPIWGFQEWYDGKTLSVALPAASGGWLPAQVFSSPVTLTPNSWHMITSVVSSAGYSFYIDGVLATAGATGGTPQMVNTGQSSSLTVGGRGTGYGGTTNASIDNFNLCSGVLTAAQIQSLYLGDALANGGLPRNTPVQLASGATFDLTSYSPTIDSLSGSAGSTVTTSAAASVTLTLAPAGTATFSGSLQDGAGQLSLAMDGPGTQILSGTCSYTGSTNVSGGVLVIAAPGAIDRSNALVGGGSGIVELVPNGSLNAGVANGFAGAISLAGGTLAIPSAGTFSLGSLLVSVGTNTIQSGQTLSLFGNGGLLMSSGSNATINMTGGLLTQGGPGGVGLGDAAQYGGVIAVGDPAGGGPGGLSNPAVFNLSGGTVQANGAGLEVGTHGCSGIVNQSGGVVSVAGYNVFSVGGGIVGHFAGSGTYNLSAGTLNTGYYGNGFSEIGVAGGTGAMNVSGGLWNVAASAPNNGGLSGSNPLCIGSGSTNDPVGSGTVTLSGGTVNAFGGVTVGDVYSHGGAAAGLLDLAGGMLDLTAGTAAGNPAQGKIVVGPGGA